MNHELVAHDRRPPARSKAPAWFDARMQEEGPNWSASRMIPLSRRLPHLRARLFRRGTLLDALAIFVLGLGALGMMLPLIWMASTSLRPLQESFSFPPAWLPRKWQLDYYVALFHTSVPFATF